MADLSSAAAASALDGAELIPVLQGGAFKKATGAQLRTLSAPYLHFRVFKSNTAGAITAFTMATTYGAFGEFQFHIDLDQFPATHFRIVTRSHSSTAANLTVQLSGASNGTGPANSAGDDLPNITSSIGIWDSGWIARNDGATGFKQYFVCCKAASGTPNWQVLTCDVHFKIA